MDTKDINLGYVGFVPKGNWDGSVKYNRYNLVIHDYSVWYAKKDNVGAEPQEGSDYWGLMVDGSPIKDIAGLTESYVDVVAKADCTVTVDGKSVSLPAKTRTRLEPKLSLLLNNANIVYVGAGHLDTSGFTDTKQMFTNAKLLANVDVSDWNMSKVATPGADWYGMFQNCASLKTLDVSDWDTSSFTATSLMFAGCSALTTLDVSGWDMSKVTKMFAMFSGCSSLQTLDVSGWDTSKVTAMQEMFSGCSSLQTLDVSGWDTSKVTAMGAMFYGCSSLQTLDVSGWDTSKVTTMREMFSYCKGIKKFDLRSWDISSVTTMQGMFNNCTCDIDMSGVKTDSLTDVNSLCSQGTFGTVNLSGWDTSKVTNMRGVFGWSGVNSINLDGWSTESVTDWQHMFQCNAKTLVLGEGFFKSALTAITIDMSNWTDDSVRTSLVTNSYDRAANGLGTLTITLSSQTKKVLTEDDIAAMTAKGYAIV